MSEHDFPSDLRERYRPVRLLGAGGMGAVFEAQDPRLERPVAIKLLHRAAGDQLFFGSLMTAAVELDLPPEPSTAGGWLLRSQVLREVISVRRRIGVALGELVEDEGGTP